MATYITGGTLNTNTTPAGNWDTWLQQEIQANNDAAAQASTWAIAFAAQMVIYFALWDDAVDNRDDALDAQEAALSYLDNADATVDFPQMKLKQTVLTDLELPDLGACTDPLVCLDEHLSDAKPVDDKADAQSRRACGGAPEGWGMYEGQLYASRAAAYTGGIVHNANKRRVEGFRQNKTQLALRAQSSSRMAIGPILAGYQQAASIHEQLASIFLQGFQSAGAGLGVSLERMSGNVGSGGTASV